MKAKGKKCGVVEDGKKCKEGILARGMCSKHYQRVYRHSSTEKKSPGGTKSELRLEAEEMVKDYRGKDAYYDIKITLEAEGHDRVKVRETLWRVLRGKKKRARART